MDILHHIGLTINNDKKMLLEIRRIHKESLRLPSEFGKVRRWERDLAKLVNVAYIEMCKYWEPGELLNDAPIFAPNEVFSVTYCEVES